MKNKKAFFLIASFLFLSAFGLQSCQQNDEPVLPDPVTIEFWRVFDDSGVFEPIIQEYQRQNPYVTINYRKLTFAEYEETIVNSLAAGKGPDIWSIHNTWLPKHQDKLAPAPESILSYQAYTDTFVDVARDDFTTTGVVIDPTTGQEVQASSIYAIPLSVDTLALYYNKDLFNSASIIDPPETWTEMLRATEQITKRDSVGDVSLSAIAMGTASNVNRAPDILSLLMLQNGTQMTSEDGFTATFNRSRIDSASGEEFFPGLDALRFYTQFADPRKEVYTWTPTKDNSIDAFASEELAMMINYSYQRVNLFDKAPKLNYGIARAPQIDGSNKEVNFANYWGEAVSNSSQNQEEAWRFLLFLAQQTQAQSYADATDRPSARRDVLKEQLNNPELRIFAEQALTAKSWRQTDSGAIDGIFNLMIDSVVLGEAEAEDALSAAAQQTTAILNK